MILGALVDYYARLESDPESDVAPFGWSRQRIGFVIVLNPDGSLHAVEPPPGGDADARRRFTLVVPGQSKPTGAGINPCFLWDNAAYLLGLVPEGRDDPGWARMRFEAFRDRHLAIEGEVADLTYGAVCEFLRSWSPDILAVRQDIIETATGFGVFRLRTAQEYVHECESVARYWNGQVATLADHGVDAPSLVTGDVERLARLHEPKIKGVRGGQTSGTLLASFNLEAFESYGKTQGLNAPVGERDAFRYCTALNRLLADDRRRAQVGDATIVFWAARPHPIEDITGYLISGSEDAETVQRVESFFSALRQGRPSDVLNDVPTPFYVLGLSPNASRLSVRFWLAGSVGAFLDRLARHSTALALDGAPEGYVFPTLRRLANETAPPKKGWPDEDKTSPVLAGELVRCVLGGGVYPRSLLTGIVRRIRAEGCVDPGKRKDWRAALHRRASIIKACLTYGSVHLQSEIPMSLNEEHPETAYQLGRLFAVLEKTQDEAYGGRLNTTIRDRYFGAASATPATVFPRLLRLHAHHLDKIEHAGRRVNLERLVGGICDRVDAIAAFPSHLPIEGQGLFFLGYYQQRQDLFTSKKSSDTATAGT